MVTSILHTRKKDSLCAIRTGSASAEKGGGWCHPQGDMHMMAARLGCQSTMFGTVLANSCPGFMDRLSISGGEGCLGSE